MTKEELDAIRAIIREETRAIVQEETRAVIREETRAIVQEETRAIVQEELEPIREDIAAIKEDAEITRVAVNALGEWAENVAIVTAVTYPVKHGKKAE